MAIVTAEKIFVDVNDEINFVVEKLLSSENDKVILVCPHNALIVSSQVSIKILVKQMLKSKKLAILVTEDAYGQRVAEAAGLVTADKVSQITAQMWEIAAARKESLLESREAVKQELLTQRGLIEKQTESADVVSELVLESDTAELEEVESPTQLEDNDQELKGAIQRKRPEPKLVELGSLKIMAGGDISTVAGTTANMAKNTDTNPNEADAAARREIQLADNKLKGGFTGRDWTKYTAGSQKKSILSKIPFLNRDKAFRGDIDPVKEKQRKRIILATVVGIVGLLLLVMYLIIFSWASVDVRLVLVKTEVPIEQTINVDTNVEEIDEDSVTVPGIVFPERSVTNEDGETEAAYGVELSGSRTAQATGDGERGEKAAGLIEIWNKTEATITLPKGTKVTAVSSDLVYVLDERVELPAAESNGTEDDPVADYGGIDLEWRVVASELGEEYNIESGSNADMSIEGYNTDQLIGKAFEEISGGTKEEFVAVSEEDFTNLRTEIRNQLIEQGVERLKNNVPDGYRFIEGTERFFGNGGTSSPEVGEEAEEFTVNLEGFLTGIAVSEDDLGSAIQLLILSNKEAEGEGAAEEGEFEVTGLDNATFRDVKRSDDGRKASFVVTSSGNLQTVLTDEQVKQGLYNKSEEQALEFLAELPSVESYSLTYSPNFVPTFLRRMPGDPNRISVIIE